MGIVTDYYLNSGLKKAERLGNRVSETWKNSSVKETVEALQHFRFQEEEQVEVEDELYEITDRDVVRTLMTGEEFYRADRLYEDPDGNFRRSYNTDNIKEGQIK